MRAKKELILAILLFISVGLAMVLDRSGTVKALALREPFYRGRPASYWRDVLRDNGGLGEVTQETVELFGERSALPILKHCLRDEDPNVRWPATRLLYEVYDWNSVEPLLCDILENDPDPQVKYAALIVFAKMNRNSQQSIPHILTVAKDDANGTLQMAAHSALWLIREEAAIQAGNWQEFRSDELGFSIMLPGLPNHKIRKSENEFGEFETHVFESIIGAARFSVSVSLIQPEVKEHYSEVDRYDSMAANFGPMLGGNLVSDEEVAIGMHIGRQFVLEHDEFTVINRMLLNGDRGYSVLLIIPGPWFANNALQYCLDSFKVDPN